MRVLTLLLLIEVAKATIVCVRNESAIQYCATCEAEEKNSDGPCVTYQPRYLICH